MTFAAGPMHTPAPSQPQSVTGLGRWASSPAWGMRAGGLDGGSADMPDRPLHAEDAHGELVALADVAACVDAVLNRYPDMLLQDARASWLRDQIARQILEEVAGLQRAVASTPSVVAQVPTAPSTSEGHRRRDLVEPLTAPGTLERTTAAPSASARVLMNGSPDASPPVHSQAPAQGEYSSFALAGSPMPSDTPASSCAAASEQEPAPPRATPHAVSTADAIAMRWQALFPRERTAGGDRFEIAAAVGIPRARVYRRSCPAVASSDSGISHPADAA
jgi:hypothetical protein